MSESSSAAAARPASGRTRRRVARIIATVATAATAAGLAVAAPVAAQATTTPPAATSVGIAPLKAWIPYDGSIALRAVLHAGTRDLANQKVWFLWRKNAVSPWTWAAERITSSTGSASWVARHTRSGQWGVVFGGATGYAASHSAAATLQVGSIYQAVVTKATQYNGAPYVYGAAGPRYFDCSGFTLYLWGRFGHALPHSAAAQYSMPGMRHLSKSAAQPGDFIFMYSGSSIYHVGIYAGGGRFWAATHPGSTVKLEAIWTSAYLVGRLV